MINLKLRINDKSEIIIKEYKTKKFTEDDVRVYMKIGLLKILVAEDSWKYEIYPTLHYILNNIQEYDEELINTNFYNMEETRLICGEGGARRRLSLYKEAME